MLTQRIVDENCQCFRFSFFFFEISKIKFNIVGLEKCTIQPYKGDVNDKKKSSMVIKY